MPERPSRNQRSIIKAGEAVLRKHAGLVRTRDFEEAGVSRQRLPGLITAGMIERVRHGLYRAVELPMTNGMELVQACIAVPHGVIYLASALDYYGLSTFNPAKIWVAVERKRKVVLPEAPPIELHYLSTQYHQLGIESVSLPSGQMRIYTREKTVCDCLRFRNQIGIDLGLEALRNQLRSPGAPVDRLVQMAKQCRVEALMRRYLEAMV